ncbi:MAG: response regulator transcription factor [Puniceicoccaceae bacterium]
MAKPAKILVGIIDDHPAAVFGLSVFFKEREGIDVRWTVCGLEELDRKSREEPVNVLVADFKINDKQILDWIPNDSTPRVVIYSGFYLEENVRDAFGAGAMAWIRKSDPLGHLERAVRNAASGRKTIQATDEQFFRRDRFVDLSAREREVLEHVYQGRSNEEIASLLEMKVTTVKTHISHLFIKLEASSRNEAVHNAIERGLLATPDATPPSAVS